MIAGITVFFWPVLQERHRYVSSLANKEAQALLCPLLFRGNALLWQTWPFLSRRAYPFMFCMDSVVMKNPSDFFQLFSFANCKRYYEKPHFEHFRKINCLHEMQTDPALRVMVFLDKLAMYPISCTDIMHLNLPSVSKKSSDSFFSWCLHGGYWYCCEIWACYGCVELIFCPDFCSFRRSRDNHVGIDGPPCNFLHLPVLLCKWDLHPLL